MYKKLLAAILSACLGLMLLSSCSAVNNVRNDASKWLATSTTSGASTKTVKPIIRSHTGFIKSEITFENTVYYFQDGFVVSFPGVLNNNFFFPAGTKVQIKYSYNASSNANDLISIEPVQ